MTTLIIGNKEYQIEFSFEAAEYKVCVDKMFKVLSGGYLAKNGLTGEEGKAEVASALIDSTGDMISDLPSLVRTVLYAGLLEHNPVENENVAKDLFKQFVTENPEDERASYWGMFTFLKEQMEKDGFFKLTGLEQMIVQMNQAAEETLQGNRATRRAENKKRPAYTK